LYSSKEWLAGGVNSRFQNREIKILKSKKRKTKNPKSKTSKRRPLSAKGNYNRGANFERKLVKYLSTKPNCLLAMRSAGSHGPFDVVALMKEGQMARAYLFQCKHGGDTPKLRSADLDFMRWLEEFGCRCRVVYHAHRPARFDTSVTTSWHTFYWTPDEAEKFCVVDYGDRGERSRRQK